MNCFLDRFLIQLTIMEKIILGNDLEICRILNGMWQVGGAHGQINSELAIQDMQKYQEMGFTTWDLCLLYTSPSPRD